MIDVCNYADDTTFHTCDFDHKKVVTRLGANMKHCL